MSIRPKGSIDRAFAGPCEAWVRLRRLVVQCDKNRSEPHGVHEDSDIGIRWCDGPAALTTGSTP